MAFRDGHALLIGVGSHRFAPQLDAPVTVADAEAVAAILRSPEYCGYPSEQVTLLHDESATREGILAGLAALAERTGPEDTVVVYYCGHGEFGTDGEYYLVSHEVKLSGSRVEAGSGVNQAELVRALREIRAKRLLLIFNACYSGEISPSLGASGLPGGRSLPGTTAEALLSAGSGRIILTACREDQRSYIGGGSLTIFTQALTQGLKGAGVASRGGTISAFDLYASVFETVSETVRSRYDLPQEPELTVLKGVGPFAVALYRGAAATDLGAAEAGELPSGTAVRQVSPERSQRLYQQILQTGGVYFGQGNVVEIGEDVIGEQRIDTGGGAFVRGSVNTGGGAFVGRDQTVVTTQPASPSASPERFAALLKELREAIPSAGLDPKVQGVVEEDVSWVEREVGASEPNLPVIEARLLGIQGLLERSAAAGPVKIVKKAIQLAQQLFQ